MKRCSDPDNVTYLSDPGGLRGVIRVLVWVFLAGFFGLGFLAWVFLAWVFWLGFLAWVFLAWVFWLGFFGLSFLAWFFGLGFFTMSFLPFSFERLTFSRRLEAIPLEYPNFTSNDISRRGLNNIIKLRF